MVSYVPKAAVQAAIGALPHEAGVPGGDLILALAVLSILLTAPLGAIGTAVLGEKVMETDDPNLYGFRLLRERLNLPHVGQRVRHRVRQTMWKVMKEKELWIESRPRNGGPAEMVPVIYLRF